MFEQTLEFPYLSGQIKIKVDQNGCVYISGAREVRFIASIINDGKADLLPAIVCHDSTGIVSATMHLYDRTNQKDRIAPTDRPELNMYFLGTKILPQEIVIEVKNIPERK